MRPSFYLPLGDGRWRATEHTSGPWDPSAQHGGPPAALLGRAMQRCAPRDDMVVARVTCELLGAVPVADLQVRARVARPGRSVEMLEATAAADGREVATARAWRVLRAGAGGVTPLPAPQPAPLPERSHGGSLEGWGGGYLSAVEWRFARGSATAPGPATVWARLRYPLVDGEETSPLERVLALADSGSGVSSELDIGAWHFINPELTVHLHREAAGAWVCLDADTTITADGAGLATTVISDLSGPLGVGAQSLLVRPRSAG